MKTHLMVFDETRASRKQVQRALNTVDQIQNWYSFYGNVFCLASELGARQVAGRLGAALPELRFIVAEVAYGDVGGFVPDAILDFIRNPRAFDAEVS